MLKKIISFLNHIKCGKNEYTFRWGYISRCKSIEFMINRGGYFCDRYYVTIGLGFIFIKLFLPFKTKLPVGCEFPRYGFCVHGSSLMIYYGANFDESGNSIINNKLFLWDLPYFSIHKHRGYILHKNRNWQAVEILIARLGEIRKDNPDAVDVFEFRDSDDCYVEKHDFIYITDSGEIQESLAKCTLEKSEWRRKWVPFYKNIDIDLRVEFSNEIGECAGSWKGGVTGCGFKLKEGESIKNGLKRLAIEKHF